MRSWRGSATGSCTGTASTGRRRSTTRGAGLLRFVQELTRGRRQVRSLFGGSDGLSLAEFLQAANVQLRGVRAGEPDTAGDSHSIAITMSGQPGALHLVLNAYWEALDCELPPLDPGAPPWRALVDTSLTSPDDVRQHATAPAVHGRAYRAGPRSVVLLAREVAPT